MMISQKECPGIGYEIVEWCVYPSGEFDTSLVGDRKSRMVEQPRWSVIYCSTEEDACELSGKIPGSKYYPMWSQKPRPTISGPVLY